MELSDEYRRVQETLRAMIEPVKDLPKDDPHRIEVYANAAPLIAEWKAHMKCERMQKLLAPEPYYYSRYPGPRPKSNRILAFLT
jgi:hypothetical protein